MNLPVNAPREPPAPRRPYGLIAVLALAAAANGIGLAERLASLGRTVDLAIALPAWLGIAQSAVWACIFGALALLLLWRGRARAALLGAALLLTLYALVGLLILLGFARSDYDRGRAAADVAVSAAVLAPIWWQALRRRASRGGQGARPGGQGAA